MHITAVWRNGGFSASFDRFVVGSSAVLRLNFCAKNPPLRQAAKRSVLLFSDTYSQEVLDTVKSNSKLVVELKDAYRAFHINNMIKDQNEMTVVFLDFKNTQ